MISCQHFRIADSSFQVCTNHKELCSEIDFVLGSFKTSNPDTVLATYKVEQHADQTVTVSQTNGAQLSFSSLETFLTGFEYHLIGQAFDAMSFVGIHAGGIVCKKKTFLFPGQSGNGKSTLTLGCALRDHTLLSDEMALIHRKTYQVTPFPRVLCIKNNAQIFASIDTQNILGSPEFSRTLHNSLCLSPLPFKNLSSQSRKKIDTIVFPKFDRSTQTQLTPLSPPQVLTKLLSLTYKRQKNPDVLNVLGEISESCPGYILQMNNLEQAIAEVENLAQ